jgi:hypothetical protein
LHTVHLTFATRGREPIAPAEGIRRAIVHAILRVAGRRIALYCIVDDHLHVVLLCPREELGRLARALLLAVRALTTARVQQAHHSPVEKRSHAEWLLGYALGQTDRHGLDTHPALWSGSCFSELAGARAVKGWEWNIRELLPRFQVIEAYQAVGLPEAIVPATRERVRALGAWRLASAAAFAAGAAPALSGNSASVAMTRRAVARMGSVAGISGADLADAMKVELRQVARLASRGEDPRLERATRVRLALEEAVLANSVRKPAR